ncbi:hypothetical protein OXX69_000205 [Metschnikowia pulcherrima]
MSHIPPQYPLLGKEPTYDTKLQEPAGEVAAGWLSEPPNYTPLSLTSCLTETQLKESRKRYRAGAASAGQQSATTDLETHSFSADSGDDMIITDCETGVENHHNVHPPKRRITVSQVLDAAHTAAPSGRAADASDREFKEPVHPCTPTLIESPTHSPKSPVSEVDDSTQQLVLPSPSASPVQSAAEKPSAQTALEKQLSRVPSNQAELISMIMNLSSFVSPQNKNHLVYSLLQGVGRSSLSSFCDVIQKSLNHDILTALPFELSLNVLSF